MTVWTVPASVTRVIDGDTIVASLDLGWGIWHKDARIRLARINCPEMDTPEGVAARDFTVMHLNLGGAVVTIVSRSLDKYGRTLAEVKLSNGELLNDLLLDNGHAVPMKS